VSVPEAAQSNVCVCGRSLAGIAGANPTGVIDLSEENRCLSLVSV
jgi:hypothetical protein